LIAGRRQAAVLLSLALAACQPVDTSWHDEGGHRWRALDVPRRWGGNAGGGFTLLDSSRTGVSFINTVSDSLLVHNRILAQGAGVCLADIDADGLVDVFLARTEGPNALYRNQGGWRFEDVTATAGVAAPDRYSTGCTFADVNGDRSPDLILVALGGPNSLFVNDGSGRFTEQGAAAGLSSTAGSTTIAAADVDGDGWLDLFVTNYKAYTTLDRLSPQERSFDQVARQVGPRRFEVLERYRSDYKVTDRPDLGGVSLSQRADPDYFYRNVGEGRFVREPIARNRRFLDEHGVPLAEEPEDFGLAAMFADLNGDRAPDLYVANDFEDPDLFWLNDGKGNFRLAPWFSLRAMSNSAMAVDVGDVNRDGQPDLFAVDMLSQDSRRRKTQIPTHTATPKLPGQDELRYQMQRNTLQLNRGDGTFAEVARLGGIGASGWSWSTVFLDVDLDGWEDILVGTGHRWDVMDGDTQYRLRNRLQEIDWRRMLFEYPPLPLGNVAFRNRGDLTFEDASRDWGFDTGPDISHGMALADLDGDGDLDVVINRLGSPAAVFRNDARTARLAVRLRGDAPNTAGIGSLVRVRSGSLPVQQREVVGGGLYLSSSDAQLTFAVDPGAETAIEVHWRDGRTSVISDARANRLYEVSQQSASLAPSAPSDSARPRPLFADVTAQLGGHRHVEPYFDDFSRQVLLPNSMSQLGPGIAWYDLDGNGHEDLIIGAGRTGSLAWFRNSGGTLRAAGAGFAPAHVDLTTILGWPDARGGATILAGVSSYEMGSLRDALSVPAVVSYSTRDGTLTPILSGDTASVGPLAAADYDGDGDLDLFVGARVQPGRYPLPASSRLYFNDGTRLVPDAIANALFARLGMVSAAVFSDLDGNGWPDLVVALEWGPVRVFLNDGGRFRAWNAPGLADHLSRWNGVATGDLDGDGRLDIVATSWGRNTDWQATPARPLYAYTTVSPRGADVVLAREDDRIGGIAPLTTFGRLGLALPSAMMRLRTFANYADANIEAVLARRPDDASRLTATTMDHIAFLNRGDRFEARPLPVEAQLAPAFYAGVADFDGDGREDVFLAQNFFPTDLATPRLDAGRGLLLRGDGAGGLAAVPGTESGVQIYGEQRGGAYADFDADGRLDLAVTQNSGLTRLFRNSGATPGLRVRIAGPPGNPHGVGTQLRLRGAGFAGPVREIQAGSGYWSQNGAVQVLGGRAGASSLWVRWPGGREQVVPFQPGITEITVRSAP
jgi:enediyne biosynthesis protein E4